jgi:Fic family protein
VDLSLFERSGAGRVVRVGFGEAAYHAFVPHPLPPELPFDAQLAALLADAARAVGELSGLGRLLPNPSLLIAPFIRREAVLSSRIEGTQASLTDLYAFEAGKQSPLKPAVPDADVREVENYVVALEYGIERLLTLPLSLRFIRELHERLMAGVRGGQATPGELRRSQNWIGPPGTTLRDATYVPPPVQDGELQAALDAFERYLHAEDDYPLLVRLAFIHYQFEAIHPFLDGNGRIGRLLITLLLLNWGLLSHPLLYLSAFFEQHRNEYYDRLFDVSARGAWREWVLFFLRGVAEQSTDAVTRARQLQELQQGWREQLTATRVSALALRLADALFVTPMMTIADAQRLLGVSYPAAQRHVERLAAKGFVQPVDERAYGRGFVAGRILDIVGATEPGALTRIEDQNSS